MAVKKGKNKNRNGSAMLMLITIVGVLYIFGTMLIEYMGQERQQTAKLGEAMQAYYLAEAGIEQAMIELRKVFSGKLIDSDGEVNDKILSLLDVDRAENFTFRVKIKEGDLVDTGYAEVLVEVNNLQPTPFKTYIDEYADIPSHLKIYQKENRDTYADKALGGWEGSLRFKSTGHFRFHPRGPYTHKTLEVIKDLKVSDLTPPAENYTLFVESRKDEYLRKGEFRCCNWSIYRELDTLIKDLKGKADTAFQETLGNSATDYFWEPNMGSNVGFGGDVKSKTLKVIRKLVMSVTDIKLKDLVDTTIQKLNPYLWGKIRTNGRLHVYLPFFAADDIINYFEDNSIFSHQRPEIGYLFCNNQLHDAYLSKYTYYEGEIIRYYQKLKPYVLGITETPYPSSDPYTINTKFDFVSRYPEKLAPLQLKRIVKNGKNFCHEFHEKKLVLEGDYSNAVPLWGIIYVQGDVHIRSVGTRKFKYSGKSMIIAEGNIYIEDNVEHESAKDFLALVALKGSVKLPKHKKDLTLQAAVYAKKSIVGGERLNLTGNLVVDTLNRQKGEKGPLLMPKRLVINYDSNLKSNVGSNVCFNVSEIITTHRDL
jgi:hypothetical protein